VPGEKPATARAGSSRASSTNEKAAGAAETRTVPATTPLTFAFATFPPSASPSTGPSTATNTTCCLLAAARSMTA
jgi:hypothetical protein